MYDYLRYEDKEAEEISRYYQLNVDITARPISINIDYQDALSRCYQDLLKVMQQDMAQEDLEILEASYYKSCQSYLEHGEDASVEDWAAYTSRITACRLLNESKIKKVSSVYFAQTDTMKEEWWKLKDLENETFLQIVTGVKDIDYFDTFVKQWKAGGGDTITSEVNEVIAKRQESSQE
jgi:putative aldouronate transport system substrate-binding protein